MGLLPCVKSIIPENWEDGARSSLRIGPLSARVVVTEFVDFQCPFCQGLAPTLDSILDENPDVAVSLQHFPLDIHPQAMPAAIAVECADRQGKAREMVNAIFARQDSLGIKPWVSYAAESGVLDSLEFEECLALPEDAFPRIAQGVAFGEANGVRGTPTVWVNGWAISRGELRARIIEAREELAAGSEGF